MKFLLDLITPFLYIFQEDFIESNRYILEAFSNLIPNLTKLLCCGYNYSMDYCCSSQSLY